MGNTFAGGRAAWGGVETELEVSGGIRVRGPGTCKSESLQVCFKTMCQSLRPVQWSLGTVIRH